MNALPMMDDDAPVFVISVAAELAGMHPQTLRQYDRLGLVSPSRAKGKARRYSARDIRQLREIQRLSQQGVTLVGIQRILELEEQVRSLRRELESFRRLERGEALEEHRNRAVFAAGSGGEVIVVPLGSRPRIASATRGAVVPWRPLRVLP